jgi:lactate dehydrogenase-like 2-hydroxyacid dehydrogenase
MTSTHERDFVPDMPKIFVTSSEVFESAVAELRSAGDVSVWGAEGKISRAELEAGVSDADALVCMLYDRIDAALLALAPRLRIVANVAVGYDNVDVEAASRRGVWVTNTPDVLTDATADLAWALLLAVARRLGEAERFLREGRYKGFGFRLLLGTELMGKRLAIIGKGRIGSAVARRAEAFGMVVEAVGSTATARDVDELVSRADVVSLHVPLTEATRHLVDARRLALMKPTAILINTSRGPVVDEAALSEALIAGELAGAGLDVFEEEPRVHSRLLEAPNTVLLPHVGSATRETRERMSALAARNVIELLAGRTPPSVVVRGR